MKLRTEWCVTLCWFASLVAIVAVAIRSKKEEIATRKEPPDDVVIVLPAEYPIWGGTALREGEKDERKEWHTTSYSLKIPPRLDRDWGVKKVQAFKLEGCDEEGCGGARGADVKTQFWSSDWYPEARNEACFCFFPERGAFYGIELTLVARFTDSDPKLIDRWLKEYSLGIIPKRE